MLKVKKSLIQVKCKHLLVIKLESKFTLTLGQLNCALKNWVQVFFFYLGFFNIHPALIFIMPQELLSSFH